MTIPSYQLTTIGDAVTIGTQLAGAWFRGHATPVGKLTPRVFRDPYRAEIFLKFRPQFELQVFQEFRRHAAPVMQHDLPNDDDKLGWLIVMQHYLVATRLLDWTENVLVALFFAVNDAFANDGELWAIDPLALNVAAGVGEGMPVIETSKHLRYLYREPHWRGETKKLAEECKLEKVVTTPMAFQPRRLFPRMVAQESTFTIHPLPMDGRTILELLGKKSAVRYAIPAKCKKHLQEDLYHLGVRDASLFPDPEGLSKTMRRFERLMALPEWSPPECGGSVV